MPDEWPSIRSMARWVLPVLVGPSTAVTPAPRRRPSRVTGDENEIGIGFPGWEARFPRGQAPSVSQCDAGSARAVTKRTSLERTAPESLTPGLCGFVHGDIWLGLRHQ